MRILTANEFVKEPYGTVYIQYIPKMYMGNLHIKSEPRGTSGKSWWALDALPWVIDDEEFNKQALDNKYDMKTEDFCTDDAIYNYDDSYMYVVFNKYEVKNMINRLKKTIE